MSLLDRLFHLYPTDNVRFGIHTTALMFKHPTQLAFYTITLLLVCYFLRNYLLLKVNYFSLNFLFGCLVVLITGRTKAIAFMLVLIFYLCISPYINKIKIRYLITIIPILIYISWERIVTSLFGSGEARGVLYRTSLIIARDHFPFGAGFATFGTEFSRRKYSVIYSKYNISNIWGLSKDNDNFITDTTWPAIIGETGYIGTLAMVLIFSNFFKMISKFKVTKNITISLVAFLVYVIFESIGESILMSSRGMTVFIILATFNNLILKSNTK